MIVARRVTLGTSKPSEFVFFITYLAQVRIYLSHPYYFIHSLL